ncbi:hypothetical protein ACFWOG_04510 [Kitasatospora sp. NPDC058406]|uniref:hypothetical protein n=1 Tax=Kitasatospora sp. NPDC058406 TaxID=3346483 RepID=UPI00365C3ABB
MAYIGHRCGCGHMDTQHKAGAPKSTCEARAGLSCRTGCRKSVKSLLRPTFDLKGRPVERIVPPGERIGGNNGHVTCACDNCEALYAELTAA